MTIVWAAALAAAQPADAPPDLDGMAGYWLSCEAGREVAETWSDRRGATMLGTSLTLGADGAAAFEQMRIAFSFAGGEWRASFVAQPSGQAAAEFRLVPRRPNEAVFEKPHPDLPQRVV